MDGLLPRLRKWLRGPFRPAEPDWASFADYHELDLAARKADWLGADEFLAGPFKRFLELASDPDVGDRARARVMEIGRASFNWFRNRQVERGADGAALEARARAMAAAWFERPEVPDGDYMLEVFDGISNHNMRGTREG
jgi:hypothetical protein